MELTIKKLFQAQKIAMDIFLLESLSSLDSLNSSYVFEIVRKQTEI